MERRHIPSLVNFILGIWMLLTPWILGFHAVHQAMVNNVILGIAVLILAALRIWAGQGVWASWVNFILGLWILFSPWTLGFTYEGSAFNNNWILGIVIAIVALWSVDVMPWARRTTTFSSAEPRDRNKR